MNQLEYLGNSWTLWQPYNLRGGMNIVSGTRKITSDILTVCLTRKGERPLHPTYGIAPELFEPLSNYAPQYWIYQISQEILNWVEGIEQLSVNTFDYEDYKNRLGTEISFIPQNVPDVNVLTFGFYEYQGAVWNQSLDIFMDGVALNGSRFIFP